LSALDLFEPVTVNSILDQSRLPEPVEVEKSIKTGLHTLITAGALRRTGGGGTKQH
jgi:hypothetical protein